MENTKKYRALVLHGFMQNASAFKARMASTRRFLGKIGIECEFWDASYRLQFIDSKNLLMIPNWSQLPEKNLEACNFSLFDNEIDQEAINSSNFCAFWARNRDDDSSEMVGMKESLEALALKIQEEGPFDMIIGFSQGATALAMLIDRFVKEDRTNELPKASVLISPYYHEKLNLKQQNMENVMVVIGETDQVVPVDGASDLCKILGGKLVVHAGGHYVPNLKNELTSFAKQWVCE